MNQLYPIIEGILFVCGDEGISLNQLADALEYNAYDLEAIMDIYVTEFNNREDRGIEIVNYGKKYKLVSKAVSHPYCQKLFEQNTTKQYSQAALETLAIIAYKQPITRVEIEEIRGVGCDMMIRKLLDKGLIREAGRLETAGKPFTYEVTEEFMDQFSLASLEELPELPDYKNEHEDGELFD